MLFSIKKFLPGSWYEYFHYIICMAIYNNKKYVVYLQIINFKSLLRIAM